MHINDWRNKKNLLCTHDKLYCFLTESDCTSDHASIKRCYEAESNDTASSRISFFTKDPENVYVDNCANTHITNNKDHFVDFKSIRRGSRDKVSTVGGNAMPVGEGTVKWSWRDDDGRSHTYLLKHCRYYPNSPACILSPSQLGLQIKDCDGGTGIDSSVRTSTFYWCKKKFSRTIQHTAAFMPKLEINDTSTALASYISSFEAFFDDKSNFSFLTEKEFHDTFSSQDNKLSTLGRRVIYRKGDLKLKGMIVSISPRQLFAIRLDDGSEISTSHDFIQFDDMDMAKPDVFPSPVVQTLHERIDDDPASCPSVSTALSSEQRELLRWHIRLGHLPFKILRRFAELRLIPKHLAKVSVFPLCACCAFANATKRAWRKKGEQNSIRSEETNHPGGCVSVDHLESGQTGMIPQSSGHRVQDRYVGATVFVDNFSRFSYVHMMTSINTQQTMEAKLAFERLALSHGVIVSSYRADNGRFSDSDFMRHCEENNQAITFCGVGAHHQNGIAERHIRTLTDIARTILLHGMKMWPEAISLSFWPFALKYASDRHNKLAIDSLGYTPLERFSRTRSQIVPERFHTWGCPVFVLDARNQSGIVSVPKWEPRSRMGVNLGFSPVHSSDVALVFNPSTGFVSPQYHLVFDDDFSTLEYVRKQVHPPHWSILVEQSSHRATVNDFSINDETWDIKETSRHVPRIPTSANRTNSSNVPTTSFSPVITHSGSADPNTESVSSARPTPVTNIAPSAPLVRNFSADSSDVVHDSTSSVCPLATSDVTTNVPTDHDSSSSALRVRFRENDDYVLPSEPIPLSEGEHEHRLVDSANASSPETTPTSVHEGGHSAQTPFSEGAQAQSSPHFGMPDFKNPDTIGLRRSSRTPKPRTIASLFLLFGLMTISPFVESIPTVAPVASVVTSAQRTLTYFSDLTKNIDGTINYLNPVTQVFSSVQDNDTYTYRQAREQPDFIEFVKAMKKEIDDHHNRKHWKIIKRSAHNNPRTILAIWSFKRKRLPNGQVSRYKARLCAHGGMQKWGVNYWETFSPVVNWMSVRLILILAIIHDLPARAIDFVLAFPQAELDTPVYMELPVGCDPDGPGPRHEYIIELKKSLYGLKQASLNWFNMLKKGLQARGYKSSDVDPCVFISKDAIVLTYVDDCLILATTNEVIDKLVKSLKDGKENFDFTDDGDIKYYLGVEFNRSPNGTIELKQEFLIERIIKALNFDSNELSSKPTPVVKPNLKKDLDGPKRKHSWHYRSVIGMLNYLEKTTRPEIAFAVHQCARFCENPMLSHERAVHRIVRYLVGTKDKGLIFTPDPSVGIECHVDADFSGNWCKDDSEDPSSVLSRTGFVISYGRCPLIWMSKLQTEIALSTTEAEYIALSQSLREIIPLMGLLKEIKEHFHLNDNLPEIKCSIFEDNNSCIALAKAPRMNPRTKYIALKYHHFRSYVSSKLVSIHYIATADQPADIFTKALEEKQFIHLRKKICGY